MNIVTVIPARGGSKSIPRKNIISLGGYPLIKYTIDYSLKSELISKTIVSTDDQEIAKTAIKYGAEVPFIRPSELAEDDVPDYPVMLHALTEVEKNIESNVDIIILLRPTSPLRPEGLIERGVDIMKNNPEATSVRAVTSSKEHYFRQWKKDQKYIVTVKDTDSVVEPYNIPRQFLPESYFQTGDIELIRRKTLISGSVSGNYVMPLVIDSDSVYDIDNLSDLILAEKKFGDNEEK
tara:strand:+ start:996 stop:1703 length:708 start_codon:yes stop_codon:yes gene_type:complete